MRIGKVGRGALLAAVAMAGLCLPVAALAQDARQEFSIEAEGLGDALTAVSRQAGVEVVFASDAVAGKRVAPLHGSFSPRQAIDRLLQGTDLIAELRDGGFIVCRRSLTQIETPSTEATGDVVVTGTHIRTAQASSNVISSSRQTIEAEGFSDLGEFARSLPQNFSGGQNPGVIGGGNQGGSQNLTNSATLNLRGLGPDATLTLINGHRMAYDAIAQGVDISAIPLAAIERVEVVPDGASAIYGSDAVGGVANVILRRDFSGLETMARFGAATDGGDVQQEYGVVTGARWGNGGAIVTADYNRSTAVTARQRSVTSTINDSNTLLPEQQQYAAVASAHQSFGDSVEFEIDGQYSRRTSTRAQAYAVGATATVNGNIVDTTVETFSVSPTMRFHLPGGWEAALNGTFGKSNADLNSRRATGGSPSFSTLEYDNTVYSVEGSGEGPLFQGPAGEVRLAVGGGYRSTGLRVYVATLNGGVATPTSDFSGDRDSYYGYAEIYAPLVGSDVTGIVRNVAFNAAVRYENYPGIADLATPRLNLTVGLGPDITVTGSWGKSFKAQTLFQENQLRQGYLFPASLFTGSGLPAGSTVLLVTGGNKDLKPERAETWTVTVKAKPRVLPGIELEATYFNVDYSDRVVTPLSSILSAFSNPIYRQLIAADPSADFVNSIVAGLPQGLSNQSGAPLNPATIRAFVDDSLRNSAHQSIEGLDASARYQHAFSGDNRLSLALSTSYLRSKQQLLPGQGTLTQAGIIFNPPHWRGRLIASWESPCVLLTSAVNFIGGTTDNRYPVQTNVSPFTSVDLVARVAPATSGLFKGVEVTISLQNVLNEKPAIIHNSNPADPPYDSTNYSAIGRVVGLTLRRKW